MSSPNTDVTSPRIVCLIAVLGRTNLVRANVHLLQHQTIPVDTLLLVSTDEDQQVALSCQKKYSSATQLNRLHYLRVPNRPLGRKWQLGLEHARDQFRPDAILINGSDDLLGPNYAEKSYQQLIKRSNTALVGKKDWYIYDSKLEKGYRMVKNIYSVLGAGRMFSGKFLADQLEWNLFPLNKNSQLDSCTYNRMSQAGGKQVPIKDNSMIILSLKGKHKVLSSTGRIVGKLPPLTQSDPRLELLQRINQVVQEQNHSSLLESMIQLEKLNLP